MITRRKLLTAAAAGAATSATGWLQSALLGASLAHAASGPADQPIKGGVTFAVDPVRPATEALPTCAANEAIAALLKTSPEQLESAFTNTPTLLKHAEYLGDMHPFILAVMTAYDQHYPLVLSPDMVWLLILQGLACHVNANPEKLRHHFVAHEGKLQIRVRRDGFRKGDPGNDWTGVFSELSAKVRSHIGPATHDLIVSKFSTTSVADTAAMNVALLDTVQSYFILSMVTACGFPSITLEGTPQDWQRLRERAQKLQRFDLDWWIPHLLPVLDQFVATSQSRPDKQFWCNFYKLQVNGSGSEYIHGHIVNLFPYFGFSRAHPARALAEYETLIRRDKYRSEETIRAQVAAFKTKIAQDEIPEFRGTLRRNPFIGKAKLGTHEGMTTRDVSTKLSCAPLVWDYFGTPHQMELLAGFVGASQNAQTLAIRPEIGWAVREAVT